MEFGLELTDAVATALGGSGHDGKPGGEPFVFEAAILIAASRDLDMPVVSIPIACRYDDSARHSHFRPVRDVLRITWYTFRRVVHYGSVVKSYRASHDSPPVVHDPDNRLGVSPESLPRMGDPPPAQG